MAFHFSVFSGYQQVTLQIIFQRLSKRLEKMGHILLHLQKKKLFDQYPQTLYFDIPTQRLSEHERKNSYLI
jgi:hypothetical protein